MKKEKWKIDPVSLFSHELKTPLSSLKLGLSLIEENFEKNKEILYLMQFEVDKMIDFITDNLDLRFIQEKKLLFQMEWRSFKPVLSKVCLSLKLIAQKENIQFDIRRERGVDFELFMDSKWMACLLENLLTNAIKFSPKDSKISIKYGMDNNSFVCFVEDEGPGLSKDGKIFEPFYKPFLKSKKGLKNTGLGLSIAQAIVLAHKGDISAFTKPEGKGTVFRFTIPKVRLLKQTA